MKYKLTLARLLPVAAINMKPLSSEVIVEAESETGARAWFRQAALKPPFSALVLTDVKEVKG